MNDTSSTTGSDTSVGAGAEATQTGADAMSTEQAQAALENLVTDTTEPSTETTQQQPETSEEPARDEPAKPEEDTDAAEMRTDAGKRALVTLRGEVKSLRQENEDLKAQIDKLEGERFTARVTRIATGRLRHPDAAIRLVDGIDRNSDDKSIEKAVAAVAKAMPELAINLPMGPTGKVGTNVGDLISDTVQLDTNGADTQNAALFTAQMSGFGY